MNTISPIPNVPMALLTSLPLRSEHWRSLALNASWQATRMNLNTFARHGVFSSSSAVQTIANRLRDRKEIARAKALPYQLLAAAIHANDMPPAIRDALHDALEVATEQVPGFAGAVWVLVDVSGSMHSPVTGDRGSATTAVQCVQVAGLVAASVLRRNPTARILAFSDQAAPVDLTPRDTVMTNAQRLAALPSEGTDCSAPLRWMNDRRERGDLVLLVSDNESWIGTRRGPGPTQTLVEWERFRERNPTAKLVCLDLQPNPHTQAIDREDILNVGGFSDAVFEVIASFARSKDVPGGNAARWLDEIRAIKP
jgi:60 kDa SS-A/Ro ribonucleoprotein